ncbi:Peptidase family M23 [Arthrobacter sp. cf158]|uniref:M23 family metallopeptidase n=1 Tax=Arthrobacter sp. cf158 TaxID=1761744 RepID=UPI000895FE18|nr:M23 family metallopeptidase [Arthrobacter sp. cf158]SDW32632.1 Peptidase family M23 [Arthrobacter sp. cf158]
MRRPVDAPLTQDFGSGATAGVVANSNPNSGMGYYVYLYGNYQPDGHTGQDYGAASGSPVYAVTFGTVLHVGRLSGTYADNPWWLLPSFFGYGYVVDHGAFIGIYGHCLDGGSRVAVGQRVNEGQVLGPSGSTGASVNPHLHFEILRDGYVLNSRYFGRSNPEDLFKGSIEYAGQTTTPQEDELSAAEVKEIKDHINALLLSGYDWGGRKDNPGLIPHVLENQRLINVGLAENRKNFEALPTRVWWGTVVKRDGQEVAVIQDIATTGTEVRGQGEVLVEISESVSPEALAALVPEAQAEAFIDALRTRLEKKEDQSNG